MRHQSIATLIACLLIAAQPGCMTAFAAFQPENIGGTTIVLSTTDADGNSHERGSVADRRWGAPLRCRKPLAARLVPPRDRESERPGHARR